jgi:hypothetical protein
LIGENTRRIARRYSAATAAATLGMVLLIGPARISALQGPGTKPGPEVALLKEFAGDWDASITSQGSKSRGLNTSRLAVGGLWLVDDFKGGFAGAPFEGHSITSYDSTKKRYVNVWVDSMSPSPLISEGTYDKATKTLSMTGTTAVPGGGKMTFKQTTVTKDANTRVFSLKGAGPDGKDMVLMEVTYKRRARK